MTDLSTTVDLALARTEKLAGWYALRGDDFGGMVSADLQLLLSLARGGWRPEKSEVVRIVEDSVDWGTKDDGHGPYPAIVGHEDAADRILALAPPYGEGG